MINTYANKLTLMQIFNSYRDLCNYLGESIKGGNAKKSQIKEWERYFSYKKDGNKFIITEVFDTPQEKIDKRGGNNNKNVKPMMDYLMSEFNTDYIDKYFTISNWSTLVLHLLNKEACDKTYRDEEELLLFCEENKITDPKFFRIYVGTIKFITKNLITTAFRGLQKRGFLEYEDGYKFRYEGATCDKTICVDGNFVNDYIDDIEREICELLINEYFPDKKIKGKQLVYILQHSDKKDILKLYNEMRMQALNDNNEICCAVNDAIMDMDDDFYRDDDVDGEGHRLLNLYKCYKITAFDETYPKANNRQEVIDIIQMLALRHMKNVKYTTWFGKQYHPYDNEEHLNEIEKINKILFRSDTKNIISIADIQIENDNEDDELDDIFGNLECAS